MSAAPESQPRQPGNRVITRGLGLRRGDRWLFRDVNLDIEAGRFVAVVGPSGVGKSSFLGCLAGIHEPTAGSVCISGYGGEEVAPAQCQRRIGVIFQHNLLVRNSSALENVLLGRLGRHPWWRTLLGFPARDRAEAYALLADLGLGGQIHRWAGQLSGGEQQRCAVARALLQQPSLYLADEPVSSLDAYLTGRVLGLLRQEAHEHKRTVFCVLHNAELVERFADLALSFDPAHEGAWRLRVVHSSPAVTR